MHGGPGNPAFLGAQAERRICLVTASSMNSETILHPAIPSQAIGKQHQFFNLHTHLS